MAETTTDRQTIRDWAERQQARPAAVKRTHGQGGAGILRFLFPDAPDADHDALMEIPWEEFFDTFESHELALLYEPGGRFNKLVGRDTAERRAHGEHDAHR